MLLDESEQFEDGAGAAGAAGANGAAGAVVSPAAASSSPTLTSDVADAEALVPGEPGEAGEAGEAEEPAEPEEPEEITFLRGIMDDVRRHSANSELYVLDFEMDDIRILHGGERSYMYSTRYMTDNYANWAFLALEDDVARTLVECVREESRVYPRPMFAKSLQNPPFSLSEEAITEAFDSVVASGLFPDIQTTVASNGDVYYFSTEHLSPTYAAALAEYSSVGSVYNV
jgi:hypothetical protein